MASEAAPQTGEVEGLARPRRSSIGWVKRPRFRILETLRGVSRVLMTFVPTVVKFPPCSLINSNSEPQLRTQSRATNGEHRTSWGAFLLCHPVVLWVGYPRLENARYFFTQPNLDQRLIRNVAFVCCLLYVRQ
jgi:hypothetical protein